MFLEEDCKLSLNMFFLYQFGHTPKNKTLISSAAFIICSSVSVKVLIKTSHQAISFSLKLKTYLYPKPRKGCLIIRTLPVQKSNLAMAN